MTAYKQTELGLIPSDWEIRKIGDIVKIQTGNRNTQDKIKDGKYPFFVRSQQVERINSYSFDGEGVLTAGDGVGTGKIFHYINGKFDYHQRVYLMHDFSKNNIDGFYFYLFFSNNFYNRIMAMTAKSSVDSVRRNMIAEMDIILPPKPEQTAIATALSDTDNLLTELAKLLAKKQAIKTATMQQLLTGKTRLPEFALRADGTPKGSLKTEWGDIPEDWEVVELGEYVNIFDNQRIPVSASNRIFGNIPYYGANGIQDYVNGFTHDGEFVLVAEDGANDLINYPVQYTTGKIWVNNHAHVLQGKKNVLCNKFLAYCISSMNISHYLVGGTRAKLNGSTLKQIEILCPQYKEQTAIAQILGDMDSEITALQARIEKLREIKQGMMQNLLTGKIRLPF